MDAKRGIVFGQTDRPTIHWETLAEFLDHLPYRTTPLQPFAQSLAFLGGLQTLFSVQSFHIHSTISRSSVLQKDVIPYFLSAHDRIPLSNTASLLSVLGQSQEMTAFESSMKAKPSLPAALPDITSEFCALLVRPLIHGYAIF